jgi:hypothetical protein
VRIARVIATGACFLSVISLSAQSSPSSQPTIGSTWDPKSTLLPRYDWLYANSIAPAARYQLLPLYQKADELFQELSAIEGPVAYDTLSGFLFAPSNAAQRTVQESAGTIQPYNAALSAQQPNETANQNRAEQILKELDSIGQQIYDIRKTYHIETIGPARSALAQRPKNLTPDEVKQLLAPALKEAAKPVAADCSKSVNSCPFPQLSTGGAVTPQSDFDALRAYRSCMSAREKAIGACSTNSK